MSPAASLDDLRPRQPGGLTRAATLALLAHALLVVALSLGVSWRSTAPPAIEAELWADMPQAAAPRAAEPEPVPPTPATPPDAARPEPVPRAEPAPPPPDPALQREADIAREKRDQQVEREKREAQARAEEKARQLKLARQEADKREANRREAEKREAEKRAASQREADQRAEKLEADKQRKADAARLARTEALRAETLRRITGEAGAAGVPTGSGAPGSTGTAAKSAGPSASYAGRIKARIRPNITFADEVSGNPLATVEVKVAPDGTIVGRRLTQSSGVRAWDEAVLRAIDKTEILPRDMDGRVPSSMLIDFRPRE